ncbi:hypothetical protein D3C76_1751880 [compost metagenome]
MREYDHLLEALLRHQDLAPDQGGYVVDIVVGKTRNRIVYDDDPVALEPPTPSAHFAIADFKKVEE